MTEPERACLRRLQQERVSVSVPYVLQVPIKCFEITNAPCVVNPYDVRGCCSYYGIFLISDSIAISYIVSYK